MDLERDLIEMRCSLNAERARTESAEREKRSVEADYSVLFNQYSELLEANERLRSELAHATKQQSITADLLSRSLVREIGTHARRDSLEQALFEIARAADNVVNLQRGDRDAAGYVLQLELAAKHADEVMESSRPIEYVDTVSVAKQATAIALENARHLGRRTGCLECALRDLEGALANVVMEDG